MTKSSWFIVRLPARRRPRRRDPAPVACRPRGPAGASLAGATHKKDTPGGRSLLCGLFAMSPGRASSWGEFGRRRHWPNPARGALERPEPAGYPAGRSRRPAHPAAGTTADPSHISHVSPGFGLQYPGMVGCRRGCPQGFIVGLPKAVTNMDRLNLRLDLAQPARAVGAPFAVVPTPALDNGGRGDGWRSARRGSWCRRHPDAEPSLRLSSRRPAR